MCVIKVCEHTHKGAFQSTCLTHFSFRSRDKAHGAAGSEARDILFRWGQITLHPQPPSFQTHRTRTKQAWYAWFLRQKSLVQLLKCAVNNLFLSRNGLLFSHKPMLFRTWNNSSHNCISVTHGVFGNAVNSSITCVAADYTWTLVLAFSHKGAM